MLDRCHVGPREAKQGHERPRGPASGISLGFRTSSLPCSCNRQGFHPISLPANSDHRRFRPISLPGKKKENEIAQLPYQPTIITSDFTPFPHQLMLKLNKTLHKHSRGERKVQKRPRIMNLWKTAVKVQAARTLCTHVRARSVFLKQASKKLLWVKTVCKVWRFGCTFWIVARVLQ